MTTFKRLTLCSALLLAASTYTHAASWEAASNHLVAQTDQQDKKTEAKIDVLLDEAVAAFEKDDTAGAIKCLEAAADLNNIDALMLLAKIYLRGVGGERDMKKCFEYFLRAADLGSAPAQGAVASLYKSGAGTTQDMKQCVKYYKLAVKGGNPEAAYQLGCLYYRGQGIKQDYDEATRHFRIASDQGHPAGQYELGMMYSMGRGTEVDKVKSKELLQKSADQGYQMAIVSLRLQAKDEQRKK